MSDTGQEEIHIEGKAGISAKIIADSVLWDWPNTRITTFELVYPRFIHSEFMTHRLFSRNAASSRAIPTDRLIKLISENPAQPVFWGKNQKGMQASSELEGLEKEDVVTQWHVAKMNAVALAKKMNELGAHKQIVNRILEPFQFMKTVMTATNFNNFYHLRDHEDAQPEIQELAKCMRIAHDQSLPVKKKAGSWHMPYVVTMTNDGVSTYYADMNRVDVSVALKISASCCAQVSYRRLNESLEVAEKIYDKLVNSSPVHASPFEHAAMAPASVTNLGQQGMTHIDGRGDAWSGNFKHWVQYRQLIENHHKEG